MPILTLPVSSDGLAVNAVVALNAPSLAARQSAGAPAPSPAHVRGLIDTACDATTLSPRVFHQLGLAPIQATTTQTAGGKRRVRLSRVSLSLYGPAGAAGPMLTFPDLVVAELLQPLPNLEALFGLDLLDQCLFFHDGPSKRFTLAF